MTDKFKPLYNPRLVYGADYWSIVAQDTFEFFWNSILWGFTSKFVLLFWLPTQTDSKRSACKDNQKTEADASGT